MNQLNIKVFDNIDDQTAIHLVYSVISQGKISKGGKMYCYLTLFHTEAYGDVAVVTRMYTKYPVFHVYKYKSKKDTQSTNEK